MLQKFPIRYLNLIKINKYNAIDNNNITLCEKLFENNYKSKFQL